MGLDRGLPEKIFEILGLFLKKIGDFLMGVGSEADFRDQSTPADGALAYPTCFRQTLGVSLLNNDKYSESTALASTRIPLFGSAISLW